MILRATVLALGLGCALAGAAAAQDAVEAGKEVYLNYCVNCHGYDLLSSGTTFDLRRLKASDRGRFVNSVLKGKGQMPPWGDVLEPRELDALWAYVRANANER